MFFHLEIDTCLESDVCDQLCVHINGSLTCDCHEDYQTNLATGECKAKGEREIISAPGKHKQPPTTQSLLNLPQSSWFDSRIFLIVFVGWKDEKDGGGIFQSELLLKTGGCVCIMGGGPD